MKWIGTTIEYTFNDCVTCLAKDLKMWNGEPDVVIAGIYLNSYDYADEVELNLGDYEIKIRNGRTYAVKKKPKYPTTYAKCCGILGMTFDYPNIRMVSIEEFNLYSKFIQLIRCRNAYWKIYGEEMGLGKPWEPRNSNDRNIIRRVGNEMRKGYNISCVLEFPTVEMRDAFYENFKDLIERCKELL